MELVRIVRKLNNIEPKVQKAKLSERRVKPRPCEQTKASEFYKVAKQL